MKKVYIIAEAGVNHNGSLDIARELVRAAATAGADAVKFQTFRADTLVSPDAPKADYQKQTTGSTESQYQMLKKLELCEAAHIELQSLCKELGIDFISTPFDVTDISMLQRLDIPFFKVPSGAITDLPYLRAINACKKPVILSSGMATLDEVRAALGVLGDCDVSLLHCTTEYPCPYTDVNLKAMLTLRSTFGLRTGYSDHTPGIEVSVAAVALGAEIIEKHFTIDRNMDGPDHKASLEPRELMALVSAIRHVSAAIAGDGTKLPVAAERKIAAVARKSIVARRPIQKGERFTADNLTTMRPGTGLSPMRWDEVLSCSAIRDFAKNECITLNEA